MNATTECRIYVACLASYNSGVLHGAWIDATLGEGHIQEEVDAILRSSRFPNVTIDCPDCVGRGERVIGHNSETGDTRMGQCETCKGAGKIPSAEEWAIHDYEGFCGLKLSEHESFSKVAELAEMMEEHGPAYALFADNIGAEYATPEGFQDAFQGKFDSLEDWAQQWLDDTGTLESIPENLRSYFDVESWAKDAVLGGDIYAIEYEGDTYIFNNI